MSADKVELDHKFKIILMMILGQIIEGSIMFQACLSVVRSGHKGQEGSYRRGCNR